MKALSLWNPWAAFVVANIKQNETRHWTTSHRGELAICSAKKRNIDLSNEIAQFLVERAEQLGVYGSNAGDVFDALPFGKVVCVVDLHDIRTTEWEVERINKAERLCGDYSPGRFAWRFVNIRKLREPVPVIGRQSIWELPKEVEMKVREQL